MLMSSGERERGRGRGDVGLELSPEMNSQFVLLEDLKGRQCRRRQLPPPAHSNLFERVLRFLIKTLLTSSLSLSLSLFLPLYLSLSLRLLKFIRLCLM